MKMQTIQANQDMRQSQSMNSGKPMREVGIDKVTLNIAVGSDEAKLAKAIKLLEIITGEKPAKTLAKKRIPTWKLRRGLPIGAKVTLRREKAKQLLKRLLDAVDYKLSGRQFSNGSASFGIKEYIEISSVPYQRDIGLMGMDVTITFKRKGLRVALRRIKKRKLPVKQQVSKEEAIEFMIKNFNVKIE